MTKSEWLATQKSKTGTWNTLTQSGDPFFQGQGWSVGSCCGPFGGVLTGSNCYISDFNENNNYRRHTKRHVSVDLLLRRPKLFFGVIRSGLLGHKDFRVFNLYRKSADELWRFLRRLYCGFFLQLLESIGDRSVLFS